GSLQVEHQRRGVSHGDRTLAAEASSHAHRRESQKQYHQSGEYNTDRKTEEEFFHRSNANAFSVAPENDGDYLRSRAAMGRAGPARPLQNLRDSCRGEACLTRRQEYGAD